MRSIGMNDNREREISIGELFLHAFKHWRAIIIAAIIGAILLGGYSYYKSIKKHNAAIETQNKESQTQKELTDAEKEYVDSVIAQYQEALNSQKDYANTYIGKMNVNSVYEKDINLYVKLLEDKKSEEKELILGDLMEAYRIFFESQEFRAGVADAVKLISLDEVPYLVSAGYNNRIFSIKIKTNNKEDADIISNYIESKITECTSRLNDKVALHSIEIYSQNEYSVYDAAIYESQRGYRDSINAKIEAVKATFAGMKYGQILLLEEKLGGKLTSVFNTTYANLGVAIPEPTSGGAIPAKGINKKQVVIGAALGIIVAFGYVWCSVLFSKKIKVSDDARLSSDYEIYGPVATQNNIGKFDKKIYGISQNTVDEQMEYAAKRISMDSKNADIKEITVISSCIDGQAIQEYMSKMNIEGVKVEIIDGSLKNTEALKKFDAAGNIIFLEKYNRTIRNEYEYEVGLAKRNGKNVIGTIMLV